jgi:hypothetical protein
MEKLMRLCFLFIFSLGAALMGCSHRSQAQKAVRQEAERHEKSLHVGMSSEEVTRKNANLGNCQGAKASILICEWHFSAKDQSSFSLEQIEKSRSRTDAEDLPESSGDGIIYELIFQENKLVRWRLKDAHEGT